MRYSLRTLLIVMLLGGPALAGAYWSCKFALQAERERLANLPPAIRAALSRTDLNASEVVGAVLVGMLFAAMGYFVDVFLAAAVTKSKNRED